MKNARTKIESILEVKTMRRRTLYFTTIALLFCSIIFFIPKIESQEKPFTIGQILRAIASINDATGNQKKLISDKIVNDIRQRGVDFDLTKENENLLRNKGAKDELIEAIRQTLTPKPTLPPLNSWMIWSALSAELPSYGFKTKEQVLNYLIVEIKKRGVESLSGRQENLLREYGANDKLIEVIRQNISSVIKPTPTSETSTKPVSIPNNNNPEFRNSIGMDFVLIPAGTFMMGSNDDFPWADEEEKPSHQVTISKSFYMGKYEVTQAEWEKVMGNKPSSFKNCLRCPVELVSWDDVQEYIKKLNALGIGIYRLPTEAEWEYAARAGTTTEYYWGNDKNQALDYGWYGNNSGGKTHEVGLKKPNGFGLFDMMGNVSEWCADGYGKYLDTKQKDPQGSTKGSRRVVRGGNFTFNWSGSAGRYPGFSPSSRSNKTGFRLVKEN